jgi:hypothetical protein
MMHFVIINILKRVLIITSLFLLSFQTVNAQNQFRPKTYLGIIQGINFSRVDFDLSGIEQKLPTGYNGGLVFRYVSEPVAGIQIELNYTEKGWSLKLDTSAYYNGRLNYIELPFLTHITLGKNKTFFTFNFGPYGSYLVINNIKSNIDYPVKIDNKFEFGYCASVGIGYHFPAGTFQIEGRYLNSLNNFFDKSLYPQFNASRNQVINISVTYLVKLK